jgi:hypothetical protein
MGIVRHLRDWRSEMGHHREAQILIAVRLGSPKPSVHPLAQTAMSDLSVKLRYGINPRQAFAELRIGK